MRRGVDISCLANTGRMAILFFFWHRTGGLGSGSYELRLESPTFRVKIEDHGADRCSLHCGLQNYGPDSQIDIWSIRWPCEQGQVGSFLKEISAIQRAFAMIFSLLQTMEEVPGRMLLGSEASVWDSAQVSTKSEEIGLGQRLTLPAEGSYLALPNTVGVSPA